MDFADFGRRATLDWVTANTPPSAPASLWVKLHIGDPGLFGLDNPAVETTRKQATYDAADVNGAAQLQNALLWPSYPASETITHVSIWDDETAGNCWYQGELDAPVAVTAGGDFGFQAGDGNLRHT